MLESVIYFFVGTLYIKTTVKARVFDISSFQPRPRFREVLLFRSRYDAKWRDSSYRILHSRDR